MEEAERLADRLALIDEGRLVALDTPQGLVDSVGIEQRLRFTTSAAVDAAWLERLPEVTGAVHHGHQFTVSGDERMLFSVVSLLAAHDIVPTRLHGRPPHPRRRLRRPRRTRIGAHAPGGRTMTALLTLTRSQARIFLREPIAVAFGLVFPAVLLVVIGSAFPGATAPNAAFAGRSLVDVYAPVAVVLGLATLAIALLPATLGSDRERGILRRLSTTPAHPGTLVAAHLVVQTVVVTCAGSATVLAGWLVLDVALPGQPAWFLVSFVLVVAVLLALGLLLGAVVPTSGAGQSLGMLVYFPLLFFAGVYIPMEIMPGGIQTISGWTPAGAAVQALSDSWAGAAPSSTSLLVLG